MELCGPTTLGFIEDKFGGDRLLEKPADTQYPIAEPLQKRWSPLAFSPEPVAPEKLIKVLEAARWTASSYNEQPWYFIVADRADEAEFARLLSCLAEGNQEWARQAPILMISVAKLHFTKNGVENRHAFHDVGAAATSMAIQATALGLFIHQMAGFDVLKAREIYQICDGFEPVAAIALGYLGNSQMLSDRLQTREFAPRTRKPLTEFVFTGQWNRTSPLVNS